MGRWFRFWRRKQRPSPAAPPPSPKTKAPPPKAEEAKAPHGESLHILTEYVLHMSITSLADGDITPLYEEYMGDPRLGAAEKEELTQAYLTLQLRNVQAIAEHPETAPEESA